eukprot:337348_1
MKNILDVNMESILSIEFNQIKDTKLQLVGLFVNEKNNNFLWGWNNHNRYSCVHNHKCCDISSYAFTENVDMVFKNILGPENVENKEDTHCKHIVDVGEIFFTHETNIDERHFCTLDLVLSE